MTAVNKFPLPGVANANLIGVDLSQALTPQTIPLMAGAVIVFDNNTATLAQVIAAMQSFIDQHGTKSGQGAGSSGGAQTPEIVASPTLKAITPALTAATLT